MLETRFMEYLKKRGKISAQDYSTSLEVALTLNLRLGSIAYYKRLLSRKDLVAIIDHQTKHNILFGETAMKLGLLNEKQLEELLIEQRVMSVSPYQIMVDRGIITEKDLNKEYNEFVKKEAEEETKLIKSDSDE
ncbi:MAG: hypothetical protein FJ278_03355 [Planctomycetes bacterium]|nr:hypothetical protein [Planctomycetota bacterium]